MQKKQLFFAFLKPLVIAENNQIRQQRKKLMRLKNSSTKNNHDRNWLQQLAKTYGIKPKAPADAPMLNALLQRVDIIPLEMALAQAANESAWGTSRFAQQGNNYFGQWCYQKGCGLIPAHRAPHARHEVKRFDSPAQSVHAYMKNMNTLPAYAEFRNIRNRLRLQSRPLSAERLAYGLRAYSERGIHYVKTIQSMILSNRELIRCS